MIGELSEVHTMAMLRFYHTLTIQYDRRLLTKKTKYYLTTITTTTMLQGPAIGKQKGTIVFLLAQVYSLVEPHHSYTNRLYYIEGVTHRELNFILHLRR